MTTAAERAKEMNPMPIETIQELVGYELDAPAVAAERDVKEILTHAGAEFEALVNSMVEGSNRIR